MPDALELPGMLRAVVKLMGGERSAGFCGSVVNKFVALAFGHAARARSGFTRRRAGLDPGFAAVIGALNNLAEPAAGLRGVDAVGILGRSFHVVNLPAGEMRAVHVPLFPLAVRGQNECALACANQDSYSAHSVLPPVIGSMPMRNGKYFTSTP